MTGRVPRGVPDALDDLAEGRVVSDDDWEWILGGSSKD